METEMTQGEQIEKLARTDERRKILAMLKSKGSEDLEKYLEAKLEESDTMLVKFGQISINCREPEKLRDFYAGLLGGEKRQLFGCLGLVVPNGPTILFLHCDFEYVPPVWPEEPGKQQKHYHFDLQTEDLPAAVALAESLGAVKSAYQYDGINFITMIDPEGHPFCLCSVEKFSVD